MNASVKFGARTLSVASGSVASVKTALAELTGLSIGEMKLVSRGKVLSEESQVQANSKLMLLRVANPIQKLTIRDIISGRESRITCDLTSKHDELTKKALKALGLPPDAETGTCLRLYLPHVASLMRIDLTLADYFNAQAGSSVERHVYLVPCAPGLSLDAAASAEAVAEAARAEVAAAAAARAQIEAQMKAELLRHAAELSASIVDHANSDEQSSSAPSSAASSLVPTRIRTGLMPSMEDIQVVPVPTQALADLEAFEAYDLEMRTLSELPAAAARELMVAAEEARLEERCAMLVSTLELPCEALTESPIARPGTPVPQGRSYQGLVSGKIGAGLVEEGLDDHSEGCMSCAAAEGSDAPISLPQSIKPTGTARKLSCKACGCRLPLTAATTSSCACGDVFCAAHMHEHSCDFDFHGREQQKLAKANPKVENSKLERM
eukprot:CAMPEP_0174722510 /NCGR_PEP_ID=MMETSP1094-20130205/38646_1 /TAXON_ID=156173 /ORGANISM="Chrysochromulina brevifilum, Strain UTEX LB 985" /LENGTH=437 /DNA_ID=CAMNT_0015923385 /DNA_START=71 /DNA_END=1384 /DNA_ORIENTATION=+